MFHGSLDIFLSDIAWPALLVPLLVAIAALRRAVLSGTRNFAGYATVVVVAFGVLQANVVFGADLPPVAMVATSVMVGGFWLLVRASADRRRRRWADRRGEGVRSRY